MYDVKEKKARIVTTDKKLVDWLLSMNVNNRYVRKMHVTWLREAIKAGEFVLTGQGITVSKEGVLLDGQHRLKALAEADYPPVELLLVTGLDKSAQIYVDQHAKRNVADMLKLTLDKNVSKLAAAVVTFLLKLDERDGGFINKQARPSLAMLRNKMKDEFEDIATVVEACGRKTRTGAITAIYHYYQKTGRDAAIDFAIQVRDGEMLKKTDPAYQLRRYLTTHTGNGGSQAIETYRYAVTACIAHQQGRQIELFKPSNSWEALGTADRSASKRKGGKK